MAQARLVVGNGHAPGRVVLSLNDVPAYRISSRVKDERSPQFSGAARRGRRQKIGFSIRPLISSTFFWVQLLLCPT